MMLRPEARRSAIAVCRPGSSTSTTPPHRAAELPEVASADGAAPEHRPQLDLEASQEGERALGTHQNMREVVAEIMRGARRHQGVEIIAADPPLHFREARLDFVRLATA